MYKYLEDFVGNTPLVKLKRIPGETSNTILVKLEGNNPAGSVKDISRTDAVQLKKLLAKRIEYGVVNTTPAILMINASPTTRGKIKIVGTVELSLLYLNFSKKHPDGQRLLEIFDKGLKTIQSNGTYARIQHDFNVKYGLLPSAGK